MKEFIKNKKTIAIMITIIIILVPFILDYCIFSNNIESNLSNEQWASFLGSYLGSCIGALTTLIVMYMTFSENKKEKREENKLANRCYLDLNISKTKSGVFSEKELFEETAKVLVTSNYKNILKNPVCIHKNKGLNVLELRNCGPGIAREMQISIYNTNDTLIKVYINRILQNELIYIPIAYNDTNEIGFQIKKIKIIFKSLFDEVCIINKIVKNNEIEEEINYKEKNSDIEDYNYKNVQLKWTSVKRIMN